MVAESTDALILYFYKNHFSYWWQSFICNRYKTIFTY